jgi:hypothetical protein
MAMNSAQQSREEIPILHSAKHPANGVHWSLFFLFYAILLNVPFWFAARTLGLLSHGWFCVEFPVTGIIALYVSRTGAQIAIVFVMLTDLGCSVCQTYFLRPAELLKILAGAQYFSSRRIVWLIVTGIMIVAISFSARAISISALSRGGRKKVALCLLTFALGCVSFDFAKGLVGTGERLNLIRGFDSADTVNLTHYTEFRASRLPVRWLIKELWLEHKALATENDFGGRAEPVRSALGETIGIIRTASDGEDEAKPNIVLIVVESWGLAADPAIRNAITEPLAQLAGAQSGPRYKVVQGTVPFHGPTIAGETRELCALAMGLHIMEASSQELSSCLPQRLSRKGYQTLAVHGMDGHVFDRRAWYPSIGFKEVLFRSQLRALGLPDCAGPFVGTCDAAIAGLIGTRLENSTRPQFIYWMTLNSHLPVPNPPALVSPASCLFSSRLRVNPALCSWFELEENVDRAIAAIAESVSQPRGTIFVLVGDHAPPFSDPEVRTIFSPVEVPFIALVPAQLADLAQPAPATP